MFWDKFIEQCDKRKIKPSQVAKINEIPAGSITAWKSGTEPNTKALKKLADYFGVSIDYLLGRSKSDPELPEDEKKLLENYRKASANDKRLIMLTAEGAAAQMEPIEERA